MPPNSKITLYALSTCIWCKRTKRLLDQLGVDYECVDVDLLSGSRAAEAEKAVKAANPEMTFPVLVAGDGTVVCGYDEAEIREVVS